MDGRACRAIARFCPPISWRGCTRCASTQAKPLACAQSGDWRHPVVGLWPVALREDLRHALIDEDLHKIEVWTARHGVALAAWPDTPVDPFFNVNTPEDAAHGRQARVVAAAHVKSSAISSHKAR